jgi:hypothetical protein
MKKITKKGKIRKKKEVEKFNSKRAVEELYSSGPIRCMLCDYIVVKHATWMGEPPKMVCYGDC